MPYISKEDRVKFSSDLANISTLIDGPGELNYVITKLCHIFLTKHISSYEDYNKVVGVLECAKLEFYRRHVAAYEEEKKRLNGDI